MDELLSHPDLALAVIKGAAGSFDGQAQLDCYPRISIPGAAPSSLVPPKSVYGWTSLEAT